MAAPGITHTRWEDVRAEKMTPHIQRQFLSTSRITVARLELQKGAVVPKHSHENDQISCVLTGALRFVTPEGTFDVHGGETLRIESHVEHEVHALEDSLVMDVFTPIRHDWINKTDDYFRRA